LLSEHESASDQLEIRVDQFEGDLDVGSVIEVGRQDDGVGKFLAEVGWVRA